MPVIKSNICFFGLGAFFVWVRTKHFGCPSVIPSVCCLEKIMPQILRIMVISVAGATSTTSTFVYTFLIF